MTTLEVSPIGQVSAADYVVEELTRDDGRGAQMVLAPGQSIHVENGRVSLGNGQSPSESIARSLALVLDPALDASANQPLFSAADPQAIGATWSLNGPLAVPSMGGEDLQFDGSAITGSARLVGATQFDGIACLDVSSRLRASGFAFPSLPSNARLERSELDFSMQALFPVDPSIVVPSEESVLSVDVTARLDDGPRSQQIAIASTRQRTTTREPIAPGASP